MKTGWQALLLGYAVFLAGLLQLNVKHLSWILEYPLALTWSPLYGLRIIYPVLVSLIPLPPVYALWLLNSLFWWAGSLLFYKYLWGLGFTTRLALLGAAMPVLNFATATTGFYTTDGLCFILVVLVFTCLHRRGPWLLGIPLCGMVWVFTDFPVPGFHFHQPLHYALRVALTIGVWIPFIIRGIRTPNDMGQGAPPQALRTLWLLPLVLLVCLVATDWDRWAILAAPIWAPFALEGLQKTITRTEMNQTP